MDALEPWTNLLTVLTALSVAAERLTDWLKMRRPQLRQRSLDPEAEKEREAAIATCSLLVGVLLAMLVKADFFLIMARLDNPWETLGWLELRGQRWVPVAATDSIGVFLYTLGGCVITGLALMFGSRFWHEILEALFELRDAARLRRGRMAIDRRRTGDGD